MSPRQHIRGIKNQTLAAIATVAVLVGAGAGIYYGTQGGGGGGTFPLHVSANGRYLVQNDGSPFLLIGDSPQSTLGQLSVANAEAFIDDRAAHGFNALWLNLLCASYTYCNSNGTTYDGIAPFTSGSSPSNYDPGVNCANCNSTYFSRAHTVLSYAQTKGIVVFLDPIPTDGCQSGGWIDTITNMGNGTISNSTKGYQYGAYLGNTFKDLDNIVWMAGNDFETGCWTNNTNNNNVTNISRGIESTDPDALQTIEMECPNAACTGSTALDNTIFKNNVSVGVNTAYAYSPTYAVDRRAYAQTPTTPAVMIEANYEGEQNGGTDGCIVIRICRLQEWWTMTSGHAGQFYGCNCTTHLTNGNYPNGMDTTGVTELENQTNMLSTINWKDLVPQANGSGQLISSGGGTCPTTGTFASVTCITAAKTSDNTLALVYAPGPSGDQTFTVDFSKMLSGGTTTARWYDPTNGTFTTVTGSPFTNSDGAQSITAGNGAANSSNDHDWALLLQSSAGGNSFSGTFDCYSSTDCPTNELPTPASCTTTIAPSTLESYLQNTASGGQVVCLSSGSSGPVDITSKNYASDVIVQPASGVSVTVGPVDLAHVHHLHFSGNGGNGAGMTLTVGTGSYAALAVDTLDPRPDCSTYITVDYVTTDGGLVVNPVCDRDMHVLIDHNDLHWNVPAGGGTQARVNINGRGDIGATHTVGVGITVSNNRADGDCSKFVFATGGTPGLILGPGNEFEHVQQTGCVDVDIHVGGFGLYGPGSLAGTQVIGNYFHNCGDGPCDIFLSQAEGITVKNNVFQCGPVSGGDGGDCDGQLIQCGQCADIAFSHNEVLTGGVYDFYDNPGPPSGNSITGEVLNDNIYHPSATCNPLSDCYTLTYSLVPSDSGTGNINGQSPIFVSNPASGYYHYVLDPSSPGYHAASDGESMGICEVCG